MKNYSVGGLFSGVGGIELGFEKAGFNVLWANEIDKNSCITYRKNFSHTLYEEDVRKIKGKDLKSVDVLCGGFPCQAFSIAGYRKGFDDDRGNVFFEIIRLINELKRKPKVLFLENVKNFRSHDKGRTFQTVVNIIQDNGYSVFFDVLNTCDYTKIPQNRERTFLICFRGEHNWEYSRKKNLVSREFAKRFPPKSVKSNKGIQEFLESGEVMENFYYRQDKYMYPELRKTMKSKDTLYQWRRQYVRENKNNRCPTLTANMGTGGHNVPLVLTDDGYRKLTPREVFRLQGFPESFKFSVSDLQAYKQAGNAVPINVVEKVCGSVINYLTKKQN